MSYVKPFLVITQAEAAWHCWGRERENPPFERSCGVPALLSTCCVAVFSAAKAAGVAKIGAGRSVSPAGGSAGRLRFPGSWAVMDVS